MLDRASKTLPFLYQFSIFAGKTRNLRPEPELNGRGPGHSRHKIRDVKERAVAPGDLKAPDHTKAHRKYKRRNWPAGVTQPEAAAGGREARSFPLIASFISDTIYTMGGAASFFVFFSGIQSGRGNPQRKALNNQGTKRNLIINHE